MYQKKGYHCKRRFCESTISRLFWQIFLGNQRYKREEKEKIGVEGFEPPTYCSQSSRASQAALYSDQAFETPIEQIGVKTSMATF